MAEWKKGDAFIACPISKEEKRRRARVYWEEEAWQSHQKEILSFEKEDSGTDDDCCCHGSDSSDGSEKSEERWVREQGRSQAQHLNHGAWRLSRQKRADRRRWRRQEEEDSESDSESELERKWVPPGLPRSPEPTLAASANFVVIMGKLVAVDPAAWKRGDAAPPPPDYGSDSDPETPGSLGSYDTERSWRPTAEKQRSLGARSGEMENKGKMAAGASTGGEQGYRDARGYCAVNQTSWAQFQHRGRSIKEQGENQGETKAAAEAAKGGEQETKGDTERDQGVHQHGLSTQEISWDQAQHCRIMKTIRNCKAWKARRTGGCATGTKGGEPHSVSGVHRSAADARAQEFKQRSTEIRARSLSLTSEAGPMGQFSISGTGLELSQSDPPRRLPGSPIQREGRGFKQACWVMFICGLVFSGDQANTMVLGQASSKFEPEDDIKDGSIGINRLVLLGFPRPGISL